MHKLITTLSIASLLLGPMPALAETITINAAADTYIDAANPGISYGNGTDLALSFANALQRSRTLVRFNLGAIHASSTIDSAFVDFNTTGAVGASTFRVNLYPITQNWLEQSITWNTQPTVGDLLGQVQYHTPPDAAHWDITDTTRKWLTGEIPNYGLFLLPQEQGDAYTRIMSSREGARAPQLQITYTAPVAPPPPPPPARPPAPEKSMEEIIFKDECAPGIRRGDRFKSPTLAAVYYCDQLGKRHPFPNDTIYLSWYTDFNGIVIVSDATVLGIPIGAPVRPRPGAKLVQFVTLSTDGRSYVVTDPRVYVTIPGGAMRHITTAALAAEIFGARWETLIVAQLETNFTNFTLGPELTATGDYYAPPSTITVENDFYAG